MSRLAADQRPPAARVRITHLHGPLQPRAPSPRTRPALARLDKRGAPNDRRPDQTPRPTRRTNPRIPPHRSMNRHFETPQLADAAARTPVLVIAEDAQWLDRPTSDVLAFVARRVSLEPIVVMAAIREGWPSALGDAGVPELL